MIASSPAAVPRPDELLRISRIIPVITIEQVKHDVPLARSRLGRRRCRQGASRRCALGRHLLAVGQSEGAARFAGIRVRPVRLVAYAGSGLLAGLTGFLLSGFTGGAALNMGDAYLMESIAVAVLGGTSVAGGQASAIGIWGAALFFNLLATMLNAFHTQAGLRFVLTGAVIILTVALVPRAERRT